MLFREVIGHEGVKTRLVNAVKEGRISHALLLSGPEGTGGLPLALAFAQYITCENPGSDDSCGSCSACIKNNKLAHPDVHYSFPVITTKEIQKPKSIDYVDEFRTAVLENPYLGVNDWYEVLGTDNKQGFMSVEESNDILRKLSLKSFESPFKIVVQWLPEKMRIDTATKLLKIIEEPPDNTVFLLVTENRDQLLPTILSRFQTIKINRLEDKEIHSALMLHAGISETRARTIAQLSDGNYHSALEMAGHELSDKNFEEEFLEWMRLCLRSVKSMDKLLHWIEVMAKTGRERQKQFLNGCVQTVRECIMSNINAAEVVRLDDSQKRILKDFIPFVNERNVFEFVNELNRSCYHIERNANPKILFLDLSLKLNRLLHIK